MVSARNALSGKFDGDRETEAAITNLIQGRHPAGGARAKAVIAWNPEDDIRSGQSEPADPGFDYWLLKPSTVSARTASSRTGGFYGRIEYAYYLMALSAGIGMFESRLLEENGRAHFMTRRFDRQNGAKQHIQTLCAMQHLDFKQRSTSTTTSISRPFARRSCRNPRLRKASGAWSSTCWPPTATTTPRTSPS